VDKIDINIGDQNTHSTYTLNFTLIASMNNTSKMLMIAAITSLLVMGTSLVQMKSFAGDDHKDYKKTKDYKSSVSAKAQVDKKSANQHMDQDNFCYRGDNCQQANQGQQLAGENNDAKGFNDQSDNLGLVIPGTGNGNITNGSTTS
jgi:hypothetical protein